MGNQRGQGTVLDVDLEGRPPLGEARALLVVLLAALGQAVQAAAPLLARPAVEERDEARVDLDARDDVEALRAADVEAECERWPHHRQRSIGMSGAGGRPAPGLVRVCPEGGVREMCGRADLHHVDERLAVGVVLEEGLLEEDGARDVLVDARRGEEQVAPLLAVRLRVLHAVGLPHTQPLGVRVPPSRAHRQNSKGIAAVGCGGRRRCIVGRRRASRRVPMVPVDSSQASRPLPVATMAAAVARSSSAYLPS
eukprot:scaffold81681_cov60-Phaeocystis_antarctica.AAC.1